MSSLLQTPEAAMYLLFILLFGITAVADAQVDSLWSRTFGGDSLDECTTVLPTTDGGYLMAGFTLSFGSGGFDMLLIKTDANGDSIWSSVLGGVLTDYCIAVRETSDHGYIVAGHTWSYGAGQTDLMVIGLDSNGDSLWSRTYGGPLADKCSGMVPTLDGGYLLAGYSVSPSQDFLAIKINANGDSLWGQTYGNDRIEYCHAVCSTSDGGFALAGDATPSGSDQDVWVVRIDANGDSLWSRNYGGQASDICNAIAQTSDGGFILGGMQWINSHGFDAYLVKTDSIGNALWSRTYGGAQSDEFDWVQETPDGGYVAIGYEDSFGSGNIDVWLLRLDSSGDSLWSKTFGGVQDDWVYWFGGSVASPTQDGGYVIGANTESNGGGGYNFWLLKTTPELSADDFIPPPSSFSLSNFPNPFNSTTTISFDLSRESNVLLNIFDLTGRSVATLANEVMPSGSHHINFDAANLPSGIYVYRLTSGITSQSRKLIVLK